MKTEDEINLKYQVNIKLKVHFPIRAVTAKITSTYLRQRQGIKPIEKFRAKAKDNALIYRTKA